MKLIHRYIIREFVESFLFGLVVFSCILLLDQLFQLVDLVLSKGISLWIVARLFLLILPNIFSLTVPMAVLFGILLAYGRLSEDNEITALRSNGVKYRSFTMPVVITVALLSGFLLYFNQVLSPITQRQFRTIYQDVLKQSPLVKFDERTITNVGEYRLYVLKVDRTTNSLHGVNIYKFTPGEEGMPWRITASSATVSVSPGAVVFHLYNGYWQKPNPGKPNTLVHLNFSSYVFTIPLGGQLLPNSQSLRELTAAQLRAEIAKYRLKKMPTNFLENEFWLRITLSLAPFVFAIIGIPLGIITERGGKSIGFGISLLVLFVYYLLLVTGLNIGEKGILHPGLVMWLPNITLFGIGIYFWKKMLAK
jgi:LPS export ABC transporter permease LptF